MVSKEVKICKYNDHTCLSHCINNCRVPREMFEHSAYLPSVQIASSDPRKCIAFFSYSFLTHCQMNENPCSNQEFHVPFEHGSELENT